jgi:hypothetical protein
MGAGFAAAGCEVAAVGTFLWVYFLLGSQEGWQDKMLKAYGVMLVLSLGATVLGVLGGILGILAIRREGRDPLPGRGWLVASTIAGLLCALFGLNQSGGLLILGGLVALLGGGHVD